MIATCVHVWVKSDCIEAFKTASAANHSASIKEPGNLRFDILQDAENPCKFLLYEAYQTKEAAAAHKKTDHYNTWKESVSDMMAKPRQGVAHHILYPNADQV